MDKALLQELHRMLDAGEGSVDQRAEMLRVLDDHNWFEPDDYLTREDQLRIERRVCELQAQYSGKLNRTELIALVESISDLSAIEQDSDGFEARCQLFSQCSVHPDPTEFLNELWNGTATVEQVVDRALAWRGRPMPGSVG